MANYSDITSAAQTAPLALHGYEQDLETIGRRRVFSLAELTALKGATLVATDTFDLLPLYPGDLVTGTLVRIINPDTGGTSTTVALGDQSAASYQAATSLTAAAGTVAAGSGAYLQSSTTPFAITGGQYYSATNSIRATLAGTFLAAPVGVFEVIAYINPIGTNPTV